MKESRGTTGVELEKIDWGFTSCTQPPSLSLYLYHYIIRLRPRLVAPPGAETIDSQQS